MSNFASLERCVLIAGYYAAGKLLHRIQWWHFKTTLQRKGVGWTAFTYDEWAGRADLSRSQVHRAMGHLAKTGLIEREQHFYGPRSILHVRLSAKGMALLTDSGATGLSSGGQPRDCAPALNPGCASAPNSSYKEDGYQKTKGERLASRLADAGKGPPFPANAGVMNPPPIAAAPPSLSAGKSTAAEGARADENPVAIGKLDPLSARTLAIVWRQGLKARGVECLDEPTKKEWGQFKRLIKVLPEGQAPMILAKIIGNWGYFTSEAEDKHGAFKMPRNPVLGVVVKYIAAHSTMETREEVEAKQHAFMAEQAARLAERNALHAAARRLKDEGPEPMMREEAVAIAKRMGITALDVVETLTEQPHDRRFEPAFQMLVFGVGPNEASVLAAYQQLIPTAVGENNDGGKLVPFYEVDWAPSLGLDKTTMRAARVSLVKLALVKIQFGPEYQILLGATKKYLDRLNAITKPVEYAPKTQATNQPDVVAHNDNANDVPAKKAI